MSSSSTALIARLLAPTTHTVQPADPVPSFDSMCPRVPLTLTFNVEGKSHDGAYGRELMDISRTWSKIGQTVKKTSKWSCQL